MSARQETISKDSVCIVPTSGYKFKSEGVTCFTLCDGDIVGKTLSNGKKVRYNVGAIDVAREIIRNANAQERALLKRLIEEAGG